MDVAIIGAGIAGLTTAWRLHAAGHRVTLYDAPDLPTPHQPTPGGSLCLHTLPLLAIAPHRLPSWRDDGHTPLRWRPTWNRQQWHWLRTYLRAGRTAERQRTLHALQDLAELSQRILSELHTLPHLHYHHDRPGHLILHRNRKDFDAARRAIEQNSDLNGTLHLLTSDDCAARFPFLAPALPHLAGAIHSPQDETLHTRQLIRALTAHLLTKAPAVRIMYGLPAQQLDIRGKRIVALHTPEGRFATDAVILTDGSETRLLAPLPDIRLPLIPIRHYALEHPLPDGAASPLPLSLTDHARHLHATPLGDRLHLTGLPEIAQPHTPLSTARANALQQYAADLLGPPAAPAEATAFTTAATPSGRPLIGAQPGYTNLWYNLGHAPLGLALVFGAAELLASLIGNTPPPADPAPFAPPPAQKT